MLKFQVPVEAGNKSIQDPEFGVKLQQLLADMNAEAAYFATTNGRRGGYIIVNFDDPSQIPSFADPLFYWLNAEVEFIPVMVAADLAKVDFARILGQWAK